MVTLNGADWHVMPSMVMLMYSMLEMEKHLAKKQLESSNWQVHWLQSTLIQLKLNS